MLLGLLGVALSSGLLAVLLRGEGAGSGTLRLVVRNDWVLVHLCRATAEMARSGPVPERVEIDLSAVAAIEDSSVAFLDDACARWRRAGACVCVEGCHPYVRWAIQRHGSIELRGALRRAARSGARTAGTAGQRPR